ncbi:MAG: 6,7-dimethyl-8-ribityllumazine synthase [Hyphomicrobiaceae bacterium]|nr:6,7-dimethyl-8-ribityllumazine synthase [Hyphomicrobiaceae bacterium]
MTDEAAEGDAIRVLIVAATFYADLAEELVAGARGVLDANGVDSTLVEVPGVLEIPSAVAMAFEAGEEGLTPGYDGFVALGVVIRGETTHYDIVANESARALMDLSVDLSLPIGNGILTVENRDQAWARAARKDKDKGGFAAGAALDMIRLRRSFFAEDEE